ncbi:MAG TPA: hypothetical protein VJB11_00520 [archaeon]|nr:hypothetical protein [archaeon]
MISKENIEKILKGIDWNDLEELLTKDTKGSLKVVYRNPDIVNTESYKITEIWKQHGNQRKSEFENIAKDNHYEFEVIDPRIGNTEDWDIGILYRKQSNIGFVLPRENKNHIGENISKYYPEYIRGGRRISKIVELAIAYVEGYGVKSTGKIVF